VARHRLMGAEGGNCPVDPMAKALGAPGSGFCGWLAGGGPDGPWAGLGAGAERSWPEPGRTSGARFAPAFPPEGFAGATLYRARKCMKGLGVRGVAPNPKKRTTVPDGGAPAGPDPVGRDSAGPVPTYELVGDVTYLRTGEGRLCPAAVIDLRTRMAAGRAIPGRMAADIAAGAPGRAWRRGHAAGNAMFHPDRGPQHASGLLARWAEEHGAGPSVGRAGGCHGDAVAESLFGTLENERCSLRRRAAREEARNGVIDCIERRRNRNRPHSAIGYRVPAKAVGAFSERTEDAGKAHPSPDYVEKMAA